MTIPLDHGSAAGFYGAPLGALAADIIGLRLRLLWPELRGQRVLGLGYAAPFLTAWSAQAVCVNATTAHHAAPPGACLADALRLPFPDLVFDRVLVIHGVEPVGQDSRVLREIWRVLKDDGRILVVAPNRTGLWAHVDSTPFGQGQPYSRGQLDRLLAAAMFRAERHDATLFTPPARSPTLLRMAPLWESLGRTLAPELAGVTIAEAVKDAYAAVPTTVPARRRVALPEAA